MKADVKFHIHLLPYVHIKQIWKHLQVNLYLLPVQDHVSYINTKQQIDWTCSGIKRYKTLPHSDRQIDKELVWFYFMKYLLAYYMYLPVTLCLIQRVKQN